MTPAVTWATRTDLMATTPRERLDGEKQRINSAASDGRISPDCADALLEFADAVDESKARYEAYDSDGDAIEASAYTVKTYLSHLRATATDHIDLLDTTAEEFNAAMDARHDDHGVSKTTLRVYQIAGKHFYRYFDLGVDPSDITRYSERPSPKHDEADLFTEDEVNALRRACGETRNPVRNRALLELLIFTGQRISALVTLRINDVELNPPGDDNNSYIYLNDDHDRENGGWAEGRTRPRTQAPDVRGTEVRPRLARIPPRGR